jgi:glutathione S-transferase
MSLTLYYSAMSTAEITLLVLTELGIPFETVAIDLRKGESKTASFLAINPNGMVPTIVHNGTSIWESTAITMYLGETFGVDKNLYPSAGPKRGEAMKWIAWSNVTFGGAVNRLARNTMDWVPKEQHNAAAAESARKSIDDCLQILDRELTSKDFLLGSYTLADAHLTSLVDWLSFMGIDIATYKHVMAWRTTCCARPAYQAIQRKS